MPVIYRLDGTIVMDRPGTLSSLLSHIRTEGMSLSACNFSASTLAERDFHGMDLSGSDLRDTYCSDANFEGANLSDCDLRGADLRYCNLRGANLTGCKLSDDTNFDHAARNHTDAPIPGWQCKPHSDTLRRTPPPTRICRRDGTVVAESTEHNQIQLVQKLISDRVDLRNVSFEGMVLNRIAFRDGTDLSGCDFRNCQLMHCKLRRCKFTGAWFSATYMQGADLTGAEITLDQIHNSYIDGQSTRLRNTGLRVCHACGSVSRSEDVYDDHCHMCEPSNEDYDDNEGDRGEYENGMLRLKVNQVHVAPEKYRGPDTRLVGVELEFNSVREVEPINDWGQQWGAGLHTDGSCGYEAVTPPIAGPHIANCIGQLSRALKAGRAECNDSCGIHVHVDARDLSWADMVRLMRVYSKVEPLLYILGGQQRLNNTYCAPVGNQFTSQLNQNKGKGKDAILATVFGGNGKSARDTMRLRPKKKSGGRYRGLNLCPWITGRHSVIRGGKNVANRKKDCTVEFRLHRNSLDARRVTEWALLCGRLVSWCATHTDADVDNLPKSAIRALCQVIAPDSKEWILKRIAKWRHATTAQQVPSHRNTLGGRYPRRIGVTKGEFAVRKDVVQCVVA